MALVREPCAFVLSVGKLVNSTVTYALPRGTRRERGHITTAQTTLEESIATFVNRVVTYSPPSDVTSHLVIGSLLSLIEYYCFGMRVFKTLNKHVHTHRRYVGIYIGVCDECISRVLFYFFLTLTFCGGGSIYIGHFFIFMCYRVFLSCIYWLASFIYDLFKSLLVYSTLLKTNVDEYNMFGFSVINYLVVAKD